MASSSSAGDLGGDVLGGAPGRVDAEGRHPLVDRRGARSSAAPTTARGLTREQRPAAGRSPTRLEASAMPTSRKTTVWPASSCWVLGSTGRAAAEGEHAVVPRRARGPPRPLEVAEGRLAVLDEDVGDGAALRPPRWPRRCRGATARAASASAGRRCVLPDPGGPTSTTRGRPVAHHDAQRLGDRREVSRVVAGGLGHASRRRTSPGTPAASTSATIASATTPAAGTAHTSERWWIALAGSSVATSTVSSARGTVRDRLHRGAHAQQPAGRHPALGATGPAGAAAG